MALVTGPLHSDGASGTFAKALTFAKWKGRAYVRERVTPTNPKTASQQGVRSLVKFLAPLWKTLGASPKASWAAPAATMSISAFNAFIAKALTDWQNFLFPQQTYDAARTSTALTVTTQTVTGGTGQATLAITPSGSTAIWGIGIFRGATGFTPSWANCIAVVPANGANAVTYVDSPLNAGTYYYRTVIFNTDGVNGTIHAEGTATVT